MKDRRTYGCTYRCAYGNRFTTQVIATPDTINDVLVRRNIGEALDDCMPTTRTPYIKPLFELLERDGVTIKTLHHAIFTGWQAIRSGAATVDDILGDCGLVHELVHALHGGEGQLTIGRKFEDLVEMARRIEHAIPGSVIGKPESD